MAITQNELNDKYWEFEHYMTSGRWDWIPSEWSDGCGIAEDDGLRAVSAFIEFCCTGKVTDDDGNELEA